MYKNLEKVCIQQTVTGPFVYIFFVLGGNKYFDKEYMICINVKITLNKNKKKKRQGRGIYTVKKQPKTRNVLQHLWRYLQVTRMKQEGKKLTHTHTQSSVILQPIYNHTSFPN